MLLGYTLSRLPPHSSTQTTPQATPQTSSQSTTQTTTQTLLLLLVGVSCVFGLKRLTFAGAGVLAALVMAAVASQTWHTKV